MGSPTTICHEVIKILRNAGFRNPTLFSKRLQDVTGDYMWSCIRASVNEVRLTITESQLSALEDISRKLGMQLEELMRA